MYYSSEAFVHTNTDTGMSSGNEHRYHLAAPPRAPEAQNLRTGGRTPFRQPLKSQPKWTSASLQLATTRQSAQVVYKVIEVNLSSTSTGKGSIEDMYRYKHSATGGVPAPVCFRTVTDTGNVLPGPASKQLQSKKPSAASAPLKTPSPQTGEVQRCSPMCSCVPCNRLISVLQCREIRID